jgi:hypothetical protein
LRERFAALLQDGDQGYRRIQEQIDCQENAFLEEIDRYLETIERANIPTVLAADSSRLLDEIHGKTFLDGEVTIRYLTDNEYTKLKIPMGSLDDEERKQINSHVTHTFLFLRAIPWTNEMRNIPTIAYGHHEKLDGSGYPRGVLAPDIPVQTRMMTVSDVYDVLTASDRPYKRAVPTETALDILNAEAEKKKLDPDLVKIFIEAKIWEKKPD